MTFVPVIFEVLLDLIFKVVISAVFGKGIEQDPVSSLKLKIFSIALKLRLGSEAEINFKENIDNYNEEIKEEVKKIIKENGCLAAKCKKNFVNELGISSILFPLIISYSILF